MYNKPKAIVLGGNNPHIKLIQNLQQRDYFVVLFDYLENPPAKNYADDFVQESIFDKEAIITYAQKHKVELVIAISLDRVIPIIAYVSEKLNLPSIYNSENALKVTDKLIMKQVFSENNIPSSKYFEIENHKDNLNLEMPVIVKPADGTGSLGITVIHDKTELNFAIENAKKHSKNGSVIIEEFIEGKEYSIDVFVKNGNPTPLLIRERLKYIDNSKGIIQCYATVKRIFEKEQLIMLNNLLEKIAKAFNIKNAPLLLQVFLDQNNNFNVVEVALRLGGGPSGFRSVYLDTGFDYVSATIDSFLGNDFDVKLLSNDNIIAGISIYANTGTLESIEGTSELIEQGYVHEFYQYKYKGATFDSHITARNRVGAIIVKAKTKVELKNKVDFIFNSLKVLDPNHHNLINKSLKIE